MFYALGFNGGLLSTAKTIAEWIGDYKLFSFHALQSYTVTY